MSCLRTLGARALGRDITSRRAMVLFGGNRTLTTLTPRRPTLPCTEARAALDLLPKTSITSHPALTHLQIRCGPRNTFSPSHLVRKRRLGFLARKRSRSGRAILARRRRKGRLALSH